MHKNINAHDLSYSIIYSDGRKEIVNKDVFDKELQKITKLYLQSAENYFGAHLKPLEQKVKQTIIEGIIHKPEVQNNLIQQAIVHLVKTGQTDKGIITVYTDHPWLKGKDFSNLNNDNQIIINYAIARMAYCQDPKTIELAQACLQNFNDYQQTGSIANQSPIENYYEALQSYASSTNSKNELNTVRLQTELITILHKCTESIDTITNILDQNNVQINKEQEKYLNKLYEREALIIKTLQNHPSAIKISDINFNLPADVCGYLMANNINYTSFNNQNCIYIQDLLTSQIIDLLKKNVDLNHKIINNDMLADYIKHTCNLVITAQQLNQEYKIAQATLLTDLSEIATIIGESACQVTVDLAIGIGKGTIQSLKSWSTLAANLCITPIKTVHEGAHVLRHGAEFCGHLGSAINNCLPQINAPIIQSIINNHGNENLIEQPPIFTPLSDQYECIKNNITMAIDYSTPLIESMTQRSAQKNIADLTQFILDGIIINKIGQGISYIAKFGQTYLSDTVQAINNSIPAEFIHEPLHFATTPTGELIAYIENTGQTITDTVLSTAAEIVDGTMLIAQRNNLYNKVNNSGGKYSDGNKEKPAVSSEYTYKHGTYDGASYHKKGKTTSLGSQTKSPGPENGQKCLDNSYGLDKYVDRVAIEDNKYVVLYSSNDSTYHGFVCSEWKDVPKNMQEIFREHKLVHPKSGTLRK